MEKGVPIHSEGPISSPQKGPETSKPLPLHVALVVDCSKSMKDKMGKVKQAIGYFLDRLDKETQVGLVTFGEGGVQVQQGLTPNIGFLKNILDGLGAGGSSLIGSALTLALELLQDREAMKVVVLFTDGWSQREENVARGVSQRVKSQGIRLITLGLGGEVNQELLQELASSPADTHLFTEGTKLTGKLLRIATHLRKTDYFPVKVATLVPDLPLDFDLFVKEGEATYIPFLSRGSSLDSEGRQGLQGKGAEVAFIRGDDREKYRTYLEDCLQQGSLDRELIIEEKGKVVYESTASLIEEIFEDPSKGANIHRAADAVRQVLNFVFSLSSGKKPFYERLATFLSNQYQVYTHSVNLCVYGVGLLHHMGWDDLEELYELGLGFLLHDIGMSKAQDLSGGGPSAAEKWKLSRLHPTWGVEVLRENPEPVPECVNQIIEEHHERMDGSGYPRKVRGESIHPFARIAAVLDVYDHLTTNPERGRPLSPFEALRLMGETMLKQLDEEILRSFILFLGSSKGVSPVELRTE